MATDRRNVITICSHTSANGIKQHVHILNLHSGRRLTCPVAAGKGLQRAAEKRTSKTRRVMHTTLDIRFLRQPEISVLHIGNLVKNYLGSSALKKIFKKNLDEQKFCNREMLLSFHDY